MRKAPLRCTPSTASQSSSDILNSRLSRVIPALLTRMCRPPSSSTTRCTAASTDAASATSQPTPIALVAPRSAAVAAACNSSRSSTATAAPSCAKRRAVPAPMPRAAPVTITTRSWKRVMSSTLSSARKGRTPPSPGERTGSGTTVGRASGGDDGRAALVRDPVLGVDHPGQLLEALEDGVQDVGRGRVLGVDVVVDPARGPGGGVERGHDEVDGLRGVDLAHRELREAGLLGDRLRTAVGDDVERAHPLGDLVGELARGVDDLVEDEVGVAEVLADDVPVGLLALEVQVDQVDVQLLEVDRELPAGRERRGRDVLGGGVLSPCRHAQTLPTFSGIIPGKVASPQLAAPYDPSRAA